MPDSEGIPTEREWLEGLRTDATDTSNPITEPVTANQITAAARHMTRGHPRQDFANFAAAYHETAYQVWKALGFPFGLVSPWMAWRRERDELDAAPRS